MIGYYKENKWWNIQTLSNQNPDSNDWGEKKQKNMNINNPKPRQLPKHTTPLSLIHEMDCEQMKRQRRYIIEPQDATSSLHVNNIYRQRFYLPMYSGFLEYSSFLDCAGGANPGMSLMSLLFGLTIWIEFIQQETKKQSYNFPMNNHNFHFTGMSNVPSLR